MHPTVNVTTAAQALSTICASAALTVATVGLDRLVLHHHHRRRRRRHRRAMHTGPTDATLRHQRPNHVPHHGQKDVAS